MGIFLIFAFLFCVGSILGWGLELLYRNIFFQKPKECKWINPGFCAGPYLPIYGCGLCVLYLIASLDVVHFFNNPIADKCVIFLLIALCMTIIEYIAGIILLRYYNVRLWDYKDEWGNLDGIICPKYSLMWALLGAIYYYVIHPYILNALDWLSHNLAFSFVIGMFFGIFIIDIVNSMQLIEKLKNFADENDIIIKYESIKEHIKEYHQEKKRKYNFFRPFRTDLPLAEHLLEMKKNFEQYSRKRKK